MNSHPDPVEDSSRSEARGRPGRRGGCRSKEETGMAVWATCAA